MVTDINRVHVVSRLRSSEATTIAKGAGRQTSFPIALLEGSFLSERSFPSVLRRVKLRPFLCL